MQIIRLLKMWRLNNMILFCGCEVSLKLYGIKDDLFNIRKEHLFERNPNVQQSELPLQVFPSYVLLLFLSQGPARL